MSIRASQFIGIDTIILASTFLVRRRDISWLVTEHSAPSWLKGPLDPENQNTRLHTRYGSERLESDVSDNA